MESQNYSQETSVPFRYLNAEESKTRAIVVNDYIFHVNRKTSKATFYMCKERSACRARFVVRGRDGFFKYKEHTHQSHALEIAKHELKQLLLQSCSKTFDSYREVFDKVCNIPEHRFAASHITYESVQASMRNARLKCFPRTPTSATDFDMLMKTEKAAGFRTISGELFYHGCVGNTVFFIVPATMKALQNASSTKLYFDGTFKTKPSMFAQLFMAYAQIGAKVFPLAFMPTETAAANVTDYIEIISKLIDIMPKTPVTATISDFEKSLMAACRIVFPKATHQGCLFHFKQAIKRYIVAKLRISCSDKDHTSYRMAMQIAHLPAVKVPEGVNFVCKYIRDNTYDQSKAAIFERYLRTQWIRNVGPHVYSTYHAEITSNNAAESYHSKMLREIGESPNAWVFVEKIIGMSKTVDLEINRAKNLYLQKQHTSRQNIVDQCTRNYDRDGDLGKFLLALNSKHQEFGSIPIPVEDLVPALEECIICSKLSAVTLIPCNHKPYCASCVWSAVGQNPECPICATKWSGILKDAEVYSVLLVCIAIPVQRLFNVASIYVWVQYV
ncbi:uncharacterized protein LOC134219629 [Armigeres subalbatus]|uniref:uncharacterized protein LOC134219629 n=1 Tax=Armigeres subalbatus TaxID=124917 RepID=UPI002ED2CBAF